MSDIRDEAHRNAIAERRQILETIGISRATLEQHYEDGVLTEAEHITLGRLRELDWAIER